MGVGEARSVTFVLLHNVNTTIMANLKLPIYVSELVVGRRHS